MKRQDFRDEVLKYFLRIKDYKETDGKLSDFILSEFKLFLNNRGEFIDYSFIPDNVLLDFKKKEELFVGANGVAIAILDIDECTPVDMEEIYDKFHKFGKSRGWNGIEFDKFCLSLLGIELKKVKPPIHLPSLQSGKDYN